MVTLGRAQKKHLPIVPHDLFVCPSVCPLLNSPVYAILSFLSVLSVLHLSSLSRRLCLFSILSCLSLSFPITILRFRVTLSGVICSELRCRWCFDRECGGADAALQQLFSSFSFLTSNHSPSLSCRFSSSTFPKARWRRPGFPQEWVRESSAQFFVKSQKTSTESVQQLNVSSYSKRSRSRAHQHRCFSSLFVFVRVRSSFVRGSFRLFFSLASSCLSLSSFHFFISSSFSYLRFVFSC